MPTTRMVTFGNLGEIALAAREAMPIGSYMPTRSTVGVYTPASVLEQYNSPLTDSFTWTDGGSAAFPRVIKNKIIYGVVIRGASYVVFRNCFFRGPTQKPGNETGIGQLYDNTYVGWEFWDCTFAPQFPNPNLDAVKGNNYKAMRCHAIWVVDGFGVFTNSGTAPTNVEVGGNLVEALTYFPGYQFADKDIRYLRTDGSTYSYTGTFLQRSATVNSGDVIDTVHGDGNHGDGLEAQGGYGRMVRAATVDPACGYKRWSGDGIYVHDNNFDLWDSEAGMADPTGLGVPVPGQVGSLSGSSLGYGDNPKRGVSQAPGMARPVTGGLRMFNGRYPANGSALIAVQNVNAFPYPDATYPDDYTCVFVGNWVRGGNNALNLQAKGNSSTKLKIAVLYNRVGADIFRSGSNPTGNPQIYPIRIDSVSKFAPAPADDGSPGMDTNVWDDPDGRWGRHGLPLFWVPASAADSTHTVQWGSTGLYWTTAEAQTVRTSGIFYDAL